MTMIKENLEELFKKYPELKQYDKNNQCDFEREKDITDDDSIKNKLGNYEIVTFFDFNNEIEIFYAYFQALNVTEAIGQFFINHPNLSMKNILDTIEI